MPPRKMSGSQSISPEMADDKQEIPNTMMINAGITKVTLVKPLQTEEATEQTLEAEAPTPAKHSLARPKLRLPADTAFAENKGPVLPANMSPDKEELENKGDQEILRDAPGIHPARPWDFKFALFLVTLFVAVNLGLIMLLHNNHKTKSAALVKPAMEKTEIAKTEPNPHPVESKVVAKPATPVASSAPVSHPDGTQDPAFNYW